jgi:hypothetical protein
VKKQLRYSKYFKDIPTETNFLKKLDVNKATFKADNVLMWIFYG